MKLEGIIIEGSSEDKFRITNAIERLPEDTIRDIEREKGKMYLEAMINQKDDSIINLRCLEKKGYVSVPKGAEMITHNLENVPGISFYYLKTFYKILY